MPESIKLQLKPQELDYLMQVLQQRPWGEVNALIQNLVQQANNQPKEDQYGTDGRTPG